MVFSLMVAMVDVLQMYGSGYSKWSLERTPFAQIETNRNCTDVEAPLNLVVL